MSITGTSTVGSIIAGEPREKRQQIESRSPASLEEMVCVGLLGALAQ